MLGDHVLKNMFPTASGLWQRLIVIVCVVVPAVLAVFSAHTPHLNTTNCFG